MKDTILFDLDSTIADTLHRQWMVPLIKQEKLTWEDYSLACADDKPIAGTIALMRLAGVMGFRVAIVTGRSSAARGLTEAWLEEHEVPYDNLIMRPATDRTPNGEYKVKVIERMRGIGRNVVLFVDDYAKAADYITEHTGVPVVLVAERQLDNENGGSV